MSRARGFTLVEVTLGLVLTGVVALLCYGAIAAAADSHERLAADRSDRLAEAAWRSLVVDAVRSARTPLEYDAPTLVVQDGPTSGGVPADRLALVTSSGMPPLSPGADWRILFAVEPDGVVALASPLGPWRDARVIPGPAGITGIAVDVLTDDGWTTGWDSDLELPRALRITFWGEDQTQQPPLLVVIPTGGAR
jgi:prepilin-type N-terminal cleavage/methylation domain-containing protein